MTFVTPETNDAAYEKYLESRKSLVKFPYNSPVFHKWKEKHWRFNQFPTLIHDIPVDKDLTYVFSRDDMFGTLPCCTYTIAGIIEYILDNVTMSHLILVTSGKGDEDYYTEACFGFEVNPTFKTIRVYDKDEAVDMMYTQISKHLKERKA